MKLPFIFICVLQRTEVDTLPALGYKQCSVAVNSDDRRILQSTVNSVYLPESVLLLLWLGLTVEVYKGKSMQILLEKYFDPVVAAAMARLVRLD